MVRTSPHVLIHSGGPDYQLIHFAVVSMCLVCSVQQKFSIRLQTDRCKYFQTGLDKHSEKKNFMYFVHSTINNGVLFQVTLTAENFDLLKFMRLMHKIVTEIKQL